MSSRTSRLATLAFLAILAIDLSDGPPQDGLATPPAPYGAPTLQTDGTAPPDAEFSIERSTLAAPPVVPVAELTRQVPSISRVQAARHGYVSRPYRPPKLSY